MRRVLGRLPADTPGDGAHPVLASALEAGQGAGRLYTRCTLPGIQDEAQPVAHRGAWAPSARDTGRRTPTPRHRADPASRMDPRESPHPGSVARRSRRVAGVRKTA